MIPRAVGRQRLLELMVDILQFFYLLLFLPEDFFPVLFQFLDGIVYLVGINTVIGTLQTIVLRLDIVHIMCPMLSVPVEISPICITIEKAYVYVVVPTDILVNFNMFSYWNGDGEQDVLVAEFFIGSDSDAFVEQ